MISPNVDRSCVKRITQAEMSMPYKPAPMTLGNMRSNGVRTARRRDMIRARLLTHPKSSIGGALMFQFLRGVALSAAVVLNCGAAFAEQDQASANYMMPACRDAASGIFANGESH
jgi:hypothetical protein